jgi:hypothetical protein
MRIRPSTRVPVAALLALCASVAWAQAQTPYERSMQQQQLYDLQQQNARQQMQTDQMQRDQQWNQSVRQSQARAAADQAEAQQVYETWKRRPPLEPARNPLLGRWNSLGNGGKQGGGNDMMALAQALVGGITAGLCDQMLGRGPIEFRPDAVVAIGANGREQVRYHADYRGGGSRVVVLPRDAGSFTHMIIDFSAPDRATVAAVGCRLSRSGDASAQPAQAAQAARAAQPVKWDLVLSRGGQDGADAYVDRSSIHRAGHFAQMASLWDFKSRQVYEGRSYLSARNEVEYDCSSLRSRMLSARAFADHMGHGPVTTASNEPLQWQAINTGSIFHAQWKTACAPS